MAENEKIDLQRTLEIVNAWVRNGEMGEIGMRFSAESETLGIEFTSKKGDSITVRSWGPPKQKEFSSIFHPSRLTELEELIIAKKSEVEKLEKEKENILAKQE